MCGLRYGSGSDCGNMRRSSCEFLESELLEWPYALTSLHGWKPFCNVSAPRRRKNGIEWKEYIAHWCKICLGWKGAEPMRMSPSLWGWIEFLHFLSAIFINWQHITPNRHSPAWRTQQLVWSFDPVGRQAIKRRRESSGQKGVEKGRSGLMPVATWYIWNFCKATSEPTSIFC